MSDAKREDAYFERRARELGLPTDPEAYQDGGLVPAVTASSLEEAEMLAAHLRGADIPCWIEGQNTVGMAWHLQYALYPGGIRIMVTQGCLEEAQAFLRELPGAKAEECLAASQDKTDAADDSELRREARALALLTLLGCLAPIVLVLAVPLVLKIRRRAKEVGWNEDLRKARRFAILAAALSIPMVFGGLAFAVGIRWHL